MSGEPTVPADVPADYDAYARDRDDPRFTDWLRDRAAPGWRAVADHRFARELGADELDDDVFRRYLRQDYAFVDDLAGAFGHAVGQAPTREARSRLAAFLGTLTTEEDDFFERAFDALGVPATAYADPAPAPPTRAFEDLLGRAAREGGYAETLAVLVPAEWSYLTWATDLPDRPLSRFYLAEWREIHATADFESFIGWLRGELDREGAAASARRRRRLDRLFRRVVELEVAFFDAAYEPDAAGGDGEW